MTVSPSPAAEPSAAAAPGRRYPQLLRTPGHRWWYPPVGLALAGVTVVGASVGLVLVVAALGTLAGAEEPLSDDALDPATPLGLLANNLLIATVIPAVFLAVVAVHRTRPGLLSSVTATLRLGPLLRLFVVALAVVVVSFLAGALVPPIGWGEVDPPGVGTVAASLLVILVSTPLQAAAEEYGFRGYLSQAVASWFPAARVGAVVAAAVSGVAFAMAHGSQDAWLFGDRLAFGLGASWLAWRTGGLEAPIALHVANNLVALGWSATTGQLETALTASTLAWQYAVLDACMVLVFVVLADRLAGRWRLAVRRVDPPAPAAAALSGPSAVGYPVPLSENPPPAGRDDPWGMG